MPVKKTTTTKKTTKTVKPKTKPVAKKSVPKKETVKTVKPKTKSVTTKEPAKKKSVKSTKSIVTDNTNKTTKPKPNLVARKKSTKSKLVTKKTTKSTSKPKTEQVIKVPRKKRAPKPKKRFAEIVNIQPPCMDYLNGNIVKILPSSTEVMFNCEIQLPGYTGLILSFNPIELKEITDDFTTKEIKDKIELTIKTHEETKHE
jgi:hypothetical protein